MRPLLPILALLPFSSAQLHRLARKAGLLYFGAATDTPYQRERAPYPESYPQYDAIFANPDEFGQTTPTNGQKWLFVEPQPRLFNFTEGDYVADLARDQGKLLRCHALVWHSQLAEWVEQLGPDMSKDEMRDVIERHIRAVAGYYKGRCYAWDVVNEGLDEDGSYRKSVFYQVLGEEYFKIAFRAAAQADPSAKLYYNDYGIERPDSNKTEGVRRLVRMLKKSGVRIDGVGMQAHLHADNHPSEKELIETARGYARLGVEVAFTELDVRIKLPVDEQKLRWQKECYQKVVSACVRVRQCVGITLWDFYDPFSWVPDVFPGNGASLLWFEDFSKHPAYDGIVQTFKKLIAGRVRRY
ncbi:hypothetical protein VTK26DRAFT_8926 [Humicola hyalothermophila]